MENLGCVTFREVLLIIDPKDGQPELQRAADVINHELAHMWFGDLVTMQWWEGIWLNEAFATFMETSCSDAYRPTGESGTRSRARSAAFDVDALASTRPIEFPVAAPQEAEGMFDLLTYEGRLRRPHARATPAPRSSATACATTSKPTRTRTPKPPTCGPRSKRSRVSRCSR